MQHVEGRNPAYHQNWLKDSLEGGRVWVTLQPRISSHLRFLPQRLFNAPLPPPRSSSSLLLYQIPSLARWLFQSELAQDFDHLVGWLVAGGGKFQRLHNLQLSRPTIIIPLRPRYHCLQCGHRNWEISIFNVDGGPISILPISGNCEISMGGRRDVSGLIPGRRMGGEVIESATARHSTTTTGCCCCLLDADITSQTHQRRGNQIGQQYWAPLLCIYLLKIANTSQYWMLLLRC